MIELDSDDREEDNDCEEEPDRELDLSDYEPTADDLPIRGYPIRMCPISGIIAVPEPRVLRNNESLMFPERK